MSIQIIKRDGVKEEFNEAKVVKVVIAAGLKTEQAIELAKKITQWAIEQNNPNLTTLDIKNQVSKELHMIDDSAAELYDWYESTKEDAIQKSTPQQ